MVGKGFCHCSLNTGQANSQIKHELGGCVWVIWSYQGYFGYFSKANREVIAVQNV